MGRDDAWLLDLLRQGFVEPGVGVTRSCTNKNPFLTRDRGYVKFEAN
jgi:hypothetical protein